MHFLLLLLLPPLIAFPTPEDISLGNNATEILETDGKNSTEFPIPEDKFGKMVDAAKDFIETYISDEEWHKLKKLLGTVREIGGDRWATHKTVSLFLARILSKEEKQEITDRKEELFETFKDKFS